MWLLVIALACFSVVLFALLAIAAGKRAELEAGEAAWRGHYRIARWLAGFNHAYMAGMQRVLARRCNLSYAAIDGLLRDELSTHHYWGTIGQVAPLDRVPETLRAEAEEYNRAVQAGWPAEFGRSAYDFVGMEVIEETRVRQLQAAVDRLTRHETGEILEDIAESTGVPLTFVKLVATAVRSRAEYDISLLLGSGNPVVPGEDAEAAESVLPAIY
jgi:hypothetical protein